MQQLIKLEELAMFLLSILLFATLSFDWWWYPLLILAPDLGMLGYLINPKVGALSYNIFHHKGLAIVLGAIGFVWWIPSLYLAGIILFGHASMDRVLGYGLKFNDDFKHTHLGNL